MTDQLKPCPFCNEVPKITQTIHETINFIHRDCDHVHSCKEHFEKDAAIDIWNTRPIEDDLQAKLQRAREALEGVLHCAETVVYCPHPDIKAAISDCKIIEEEAKQALEDINSYTDKDIDKFLEDSKELMEKLD